MSIRHVSAVWESADVSGSDLLVLLALADHADEHDICWPSIPRLAKLARISERQTQRVIKKLEDKHLIEILKKGDGRGNSTVYRLTLKGDTQGKKGDAHDTHCEQKGDTSDVLLDAKKGDTGDVKGDISHIKGDIAMSPEPPIEPLVVEATATATVFDVWQKNMPGTMTELIAEGISELLDEYSEPEIIEAIRIACERNNRTLGYVRGILRKGVQLPRASPGESNSHQTVIIQKVEDNPYL